MASDFVNTDLETLLKRLDLKKYYFSKLSRREMYQIQPYMINEDTKCSPAWQFITEITRYNYRARNIHVEEINKADTSQMSLRERRNLEQKQVNVDLHPMDIVVAVFLCCDPIAKQDLAMHLWGCKLAVPFSIQEMPFEKPSIFTWPLHSIYGHVFQEDGFIEKALVYEKMPCLSFIRFGDNNDLSKSYLINCVIGGTEKVHPMFFHRDSEGSKRIRSNVVEGLIEIGWILPNGSHDKFNGPRIVLNLRGDSALFLRQIEIIGQISTVTVCLCTTADLTKTKPVIRELLLQNSKVVLLILDRRPDEDKVIEYLDTVSSEDQMDAVMKADKTLPGIVQSLIHTIKVMEQKTSKTVKLSDLKTFPANFKVDKRDVWYTEASVRSEEIVSLIEKTDNKGRKRVLLPLQEIYWKQMSKLDRERYEISRYETNIKKRKEKCQKICHKMENVRKDQFFYIKSHGLSAPVQIVLSQLASRNDSYRKIFLRTLKLHLDNLSRLQLQPFYRKYKTLVSKANKAQEHERANIYQELIHLDNTKMSLSFGFEHIMREIGQLYEACESQPSLAKKLPDTTSYKRLPDYAVFILLEGYPLEILDGEANAVPQKWVNSVINQLQASTKEPTASRNIHVISVLGIQSSGKSTFLNTMFGLQFAVSAGRCTRGAYLQVIELNASSYDQLKAKYILLIDTEGLRATDMTSTDTVKHDNEFSTLVIGLSDTTIINLMGENATYLRENLPIVVHAFLRMDLVGLHPRCTIVHHNVDKRNKDKLLEQGRVLEEVLNDLTSRACKMENVPKRSFRDMIEFTIDENTDYIPGLLDGELPMAPVSTGYSGEVKCVRTKLMKILKKSKPYLTGFKPFSIRLEKLWNAIKTDCFVFEFRTTLETEMRLKLDKEYFRIWKDYILDHEELVDRHKDILKTKKSVAIKTFTENMNLEILKLQKKYKKRLENFLSDTEVVSDRLERWKIDLTNSLENQMQKDKSLPSDLEDFKPEVSHQQIERFLNMIEVESKTDSEEKRAFERAWIKWTKEIIAPQLHIIVEDTLQALDTICRGHLYMLKDKEVRQSSLQLFDYTGKSYTNADAVHFGGSRIFSRPNVKNMLECVRLAADREYSIALNEIKQRKLKYTHRHPESILLRTEAEINENIESYDKQNLISIQFKYDLLISAAGSIINDFENMLCGSLGPHKNEFQLLYKKRRTVAEASKLFVDIMFALLQYNLRRIFSRKVFMVLHLYLRTSAFYNIITDSKQGLIGKCIYHIVKHEDDDMLVQYIKSPKVAVSQYLKKKIIPEIFSNLEFKTEILEFVFQTMEEISRKVAAVKSDTEKLGNFLDIVLNEIDTETNYASLTKQILKESAELPVSVATVKDTIDKEKSKYVESNTLDLCQYICQEQAGVIQKCADRICDMTLGCTKTCPFCKEICKYSLNHPDKHECFVHRPDGVGGGHWVETNALCYETCTEHYENHTLFKFKGDWIAFKDYEKVFNTWDIVSSQEKEPHLIWKWILVNKYRLLSAVPGVRLPDNLPVAWKNISKDQALYSLEEIFELFV
ncbi:interferon-induced very large GTPase 1-like [Mercenaria mercenaria]|uniref:interferon-induced very large GTPase 1-like n=1 Tax=Mercenaria mercenaria TaxID=6596 RepID=UPI00234EF342|nr:interferon-induced very large GTPase 1-like [Mercenaria mercenaria]